MPHIRKKDLPKLDGVVSYMEKNRVPDGPEELNYLLTRIVNAYIGDIPSCAKTNEAIGVLECTKLELSRMKILRNI